MKKYIAILVLCFAFTQLHAQLTRPQKLFIAKRFAPEVRLHDNDLSYPMNANDYIRKCALEEEFTGKVLVPAGKLTPKILGDPKYTGEKFILRPPKSIYRGVPIIGGKTKGKRTYGGESHAPAYAQVVEKPNEDLVIQYWFFYPYQGPIEGFKVADALLSKLKIGVHEGDWEHITVHLTKVPNVKNYKLRDVFVARHRARHGSWRTPKEFEMAKDKKGRNHIVIYSSKNNHASHAKNVNFDTETLDTASDKGPRWKTWKKLILMDNSPWATYGGRWGSTHDTGPRTPHTQESFRHTADQKDEIITLKGSLGKAKNYYNLVYEIPKRNKKIQWKTNPKGVQFSIYTKEKGRILKDIKDGDIVDADSIRKAYNTSKWKSFKTFMSNATKGKFAEAVEYSQELYISDIKGATKSPTFTIFGIEE